MKYLKRPRLELENWSQRWRERGPKWRTVQRIRPESYIVYRIGDGPECELLCPAFIARGRERKSERRALIGGPIWVFSMPRTHRGGRATAGELDSDWIWKLRDRIWKTGQRVKTEREKDPLCHNIAGPCMSSDHVGKNKVLETSVTEERGAARSMKIAHLEKEWCWHWLDSSFLVVASLQGLVKMSEAVEGCSSDVNASSGDPHAGTMSEFLV